MIPASNIDSSARKLSAAELSAITGRTIDLDFEFLGLRQRR